MYIKIILETGKKPMNGQIKHSLGKLGRQAAALSLAIATFVGSSLAVSADTEYTEFTRYERLKQPTFTAEIKKNELAAVNFAPVWGEKEANVKRMIQYIELAEDKGVKLLLFPEMCVTGYCSSSDPESEIYKWAVESAESADGETAKTIAALADEYDMWIVYGATETGAADSADGLPRAYNSAFACSPDGEVSTYQKVAPVEGSWCAPGETPLLIDATSEEDLALGYIGVGICYDVYAVPELGRYYAAKGANFYLNLTATSRSYSDVTDEEGNAYAADDEKDGIRDPQGWEWYYRNRLESAADREGFKIISANLVGGDGPLKEDGTYTYNFPGGSCIVGSAATYYAGIKDGKMIGERYSPLYPDKIPELITAKEGMVLNKIDFTASTGSTVRDADFAPELYALWYKDLADKMAAGDDLSYSYSYAKDASDDSAGYENNPKVGMVNMIGTWGDKEATIKEMEKYVIEAGEQGVDMLVFPETVLTGYGWVDPKLDSLPGDKSMQVQFAETIPGPTTNYFKKYAEEYDMIIVIGMHEKTPEPTVELVEDGTYKGELVEKIYNSAAIIFPDSETISYQKIQRAGSTRSTGEGEWSITGETPVMFETKWGKVGIDICRDGHFYPEEGRYYAASGCNIFLHITATTGNPWYRETRIGSYADRDGMAAITANLLGLDGMVEVRDPIYSETEPTTITGYTEWRVAKTGEYDPYDIDGYLNTPEAERTVRYSYGPFNSTSLILTPFHNAEGRKSFDPETGYALDLNGTGPESEGFAERKTSPVGLEIAVMDLSGTGFSITNFNPALYSRWYDELAVLYRGGYESIYAEIEEKEAA
jgi:predicted amidohydrolase